MALYNGATSAEPQVAEAQEVASSAYDAQKEAKRLASQKHQARLKEEREALHQWSLRLRDFLAKSGQISALPVQDKEQLDALCVPPSARTSLRSGPTIFNTIFGEKPVVGTVATLRDIVNKTGKGTDSMSALIKKWAINGVVVTAVLNKGDILASTYTLEKIGA